jgi:hypothetical protein
MTYGLSTSPLIDTYLRSTDLLTVTSTHTHSFLFGALGSEIGPSSNQYEN